MTGSFDAFELKDNFSDSTVWKTGESGDINCSNFPGLTLGLKKKKVNSTETEELKELVKTYVKTTRQVFKKSRLRRNLFFLFSSLEADTFTLRPTKQLNMELQTWMSWS